MIWQSTIDLTDDERAELNAFARQYQGSSEHFSPNALLHFPNVLDKVNKKIDEYLLEKTKVLDKYVKYLVQSWSINIPKNDTPPFNPHKHGYCHFNFVFYTENTGELSLVLTDSNTMETEYFLKTNDFIILSSDQIHRIQQNQPSSERISFAGDIILTEKMYRSSLFLPPINIWKEL
tara:strand:+ start:16 stop:546 length:531 start_codon:yes stop_codon:yes gene_type:complete